MLEWRIAAEQRERVEERLRFECVVVDVAVAVLGIVVVLVTLVVLVLVLLAQAAVSAVVDVARIVAVVLVGKPTVALVAPVAVVVAHPSRAVVLSTKEEDGEEENGDDPVRDRGIYLLEKKEARRRRKQAEQKRRKKKREGGQVSPPCLDHTGTELGILVVKHVEGDDAPPSYCCQDCCQSEVHGGGANVLGQSRRIYWHKYPLDGPVSVAARGCDYTGLQSVLEEE